MSDLINLEGYSLLKEKISDLQKFLAKKIFTGQVYYSHTLQLDKIFIAGGALASIAQREFPRDIDIFFF